MSNFEWVRSLQLLLLLLLLFIIELYHEDRIHMWANGTSHTIVV